MKGMAINPIVRTSGALRSAARSLLRAPGLTTTIVLTLTLTIGANTAVFSALDAVLFKPLPFPHSERLVNVSQTIRGQSNVNNVGPARLEDWNARSSSFDALSGFYTQDVSDTSGDFPERLRQANVAPRFFDVWGIAPALGRGFVPADHKPGATPVVVISARYWAQRFHSDPRVLDSTIDIGESSFQLVGVMPANFAFVDPDVDLWVPTVYYPFVLPRTNAWYAGYGRLAAGVTIEQAEADLKRVQSVLAKDFPDTDRDIGVELAPLKTTTVGAVRGSLWLLFGAVTVLLLIAGTNIAALLLARASQGRQEAAVRLALGASRFSLAMQTLAEAGWLVMVGTAAGLALAFGATDLLRRWAPNLPRVHEISVNGGTLAYTLATIVAVTLLCGSVPAFRAARQAEERGLTGGAHWQVTSKHSMQWVLVGVQVTLSVMLLASAGLLVRSFEALARVDLGFEPHHVLTFRISGGYGERLDRAVPMIERLLAELKTLPGVEGAATSTPVPGVLNDRSGYDIGSATFRLAGTPDTPENAMQSAIRFVSPDYFDVMRIPLLAGEPCRTRPTRTMQDVVVNQSFANRYFAGRSPIGQTLQRSNDMARIVAVSGDARELGADRRAAPMVYDCAPVIAFPALSFVVRTARDPDAVIQAVRQRVKTLEPTRSLYDFMTLDARMGTEHAADRLRTALVASFAVAALVLVCLGIYGTVSYIVSLRRREVGLRMALGAQHDDIARQFLGKAMSVVGVAGVAGIVGALAFSGLLSGMLFGVPPNDPAALGAALGLVVLVASIAALVPALRASRIDPMVALREE